MNFLKTSNSHNSGKKHYSIILLFLLFHTLAIENTQGKKVKVKDMNKYQIRKYKSGKERERWRNLSKEAKEKINIEKKRAGSF